MKFLYCSKACLTLLILVFGVLVFKGTISLDPDFGHRIATGNLILQKGIPKTDPFSYTMPSFPVVDHAWLIDIGIALLYPIIGKIGLAIIFSLLAILALIISFEREDLKIYPPKFIKALSLRNKLGYFLSFPFLLAAASFFSFAGVRAQVVSWIMLAIFLYFLLKDPLWQKTKYFTPLFFLAWSNLHGSFALGVISLTIVICLRALRRRSFEFTDIAVLVLSIFATFINPYKAGVWREALSSGLDPKLRLNISEWKPIIFAFDLPSLVLMTFTSFFVYKYRSKINLEEKGLFAFYLFQAVTSVRQIPLWIILSLPLTTRTIFLFYKDISKDKVALTRFKKANLFVWMGSLILLIFSGLITLKDTFFLSEKAFYPKRALEFLSANPPMGEVFSEYGWGGYLIWKYPKKKVFIDGRMPSWKWEANLPGETNNAMQDYAMILQGDLAHQEVFEKYSVDTVLWPVPKNEGLLWYLSNKFYNLVVRFSPDIKDFDFLTELEKGGWEKVYEDGVAIIFRRVYQ